MAGSPKLPMFRTCAAAGCFLAATLLPQLAHAVSSAEIYTSAAYSYGRYEARVRFAPGSGVVSSFFLWKTGSEQAGNYWNELDFEKVGAECRLESNAIYGKPSTNHNQKQMLALDLCGQFHTYGYEWTPDAIAWFIDGQQVRRETGAIPQAFADNASQPGMQIHFNVWVGDASFGGSFDPAILPVHEYIDWVQFSKYESGAFTLDWREDFDGAALPSGWLSGTWASQKNHSIHAPENVNLLSGYTVLSVTADDKLGPAGANPADSGSAGGSAATGGTASTAGSSSTTAGVPGAVAGAPTSGSGGNYPPLPTDGGCSVVTTPKAGSWLAVLGFAALGAWIARRRVGVL